MKMPPCAASRPFRNEPSVLVTLPLAFSSAVFSPRYQTVPRLSWAYQSVVRSAKRPLRKSLSLTTAAWIPVIVFTFRFTVITSRAALPSFWPS